MNERHRLDHWLKLVCVYKHRAEATEACAGGHVKLNGQRAKPATTVKENDVIEIGGVHQRRLVVLGLPQGNVSKEQARIMYRDETPPRSREEDLLRAAPPRRERGAGRPTKRDRRQTERWRG